MLLTTAKLKEYQALLGFTLFVCICGLLSVFVENDIIIILFVAALLLSLLIYLEKVEPVDLLYTLCIGVSFLPYINLKAFPLSGVYVVAILFTGLSLASFYGNARTIRYPAQAQWLMLLLVIGLVSIVWAPDKRRVLIYASQFFVYICVYLTTVNILDTKAKIVKALKYIMYGGLLTVAISAVQLIISFYSIKKVTDIFYSSFLGQLLIGSRGLERIGDSAAIILNRGSGVEESSHLVLFRVFGTFEGPTDFGIYVLLLALLATVLYIGTYSRKPIVFRALPGVLISLALCTCLLFTWTRSAILAFFVAMMFVLIYRNSQEVRLFSWKSSILFLLVLVIPFVLLFLFTNVLSLSSIGGSTAARLLTILFSISYIYHHPLIGIGIGNYGYAQPGSHISASKASFASAHNTYLELGVELGLPGLIIFLCILTSFIKQAGVLMRAPVKSFYHTLGLIFASIWVGFMISAFFGGNLIHPRLMTLLWLLAGIQTASYHLYLNDQKKEHTVYRLQVTY